MGKFIRHSKEFPHHLWVRPCNASVTVRDGAVGHRDGRARRSEVYRWCMARTNLDLDDEACRVVMERYHLATKREAVNFALRTVAAEPLDLDQARALRGAGWEGELDELRSRGPRRS